MKFGVLIIYLMAAILLSSGAAADIDPEGIPTDFEKDFPISVQLSANAKSDVGKLSLAEKQHFKEAASVGHKFMQHYLDGYWCGGYPDWDTIMEHWVDADGIGYSCENVKSPRWTDSGHTYYQIYEMCPQVALEQVAFESGNFALTYRMTVVGTLFRSPGLTSQDINVFSPKDSGRKIRLVVFIDAQHKAFKFTPEDWNSQLVYSHTLLELEGTYVFHGEAAPAGTSLTQRDVADMEVAKEIKKQAAQVCE
ncbi:MAG TPA: hypothetical protein VKC56_11475 [Gallionellaceae bacterium]|nr:hypothetical protein [Gallionellaceae bacterium]